jgi:DNA repair protein RecO (recombination protein O)
MIVRTEAVVLRSVNYSETSQIVTLFTRRMGTIAVMAKGARGPKSRFGSTLLPLSHAQVVFYYKDSREVHTLSECSHLSRFRQISRELGLMAVGIRIIETVAALMPRPEPDERTFDVLVEVLTRLDQSQGEWKNLLPYFQLRMAGALGFSPSLGRDEVRSIGSSGGFLRLDTGSYSATKPGGPSTSVSRTALRALGVLLHSDLDTVMRMKLEERAYKELTSLVEDYLRYQVEDFRPSRSKIVFDRIL